MNHIREHWSSRFGFLMAAIGSAVGLGILWKFPYTIGENGGGFFLFSYLICLIIVGIPLFIGELILGRSSQRAAVGAFELLSTRSSNWKVAGWFGVFASFLIMSFYSVIAGWGLSYVLISLGGAYQGLSGEQIETVFSTLSGSGAISLFWHFFFTLFTVGIVISGVRKGIEYWSKIMTRALLILLIFLFFYSMTLEGFSQAVHFIFYPDFSRFTLSSMIEALGLAFWTMSIGQGIMISYGSYMRKQENILQMSIVVAFSVMVVAILAALMIFPVVFSFDLKLQAGYGLIFKTLPYLFSRLPGSLVLSTMFFTLFVFTALTSAIPLVEVVATNLMELYKIKRKKAVILVGLGTFLFGIPSAFSGTQAIFPDWQAIYGKNFLETINHFVSIWVIPVGGLITAFFLGFIVDQNRLKEEFMLGNRFGFLYKPWYFFMRYVVPLTILVIIVQKSGLYDFDKFLRKIVR